MPTPDPKINDVKNFQPMPQGEEQVNATITQIKADLKTFRQDLFNNLGLKGAGVEWMTTIRIAPVAGSAEGNGDAMPGPMGYTSVGDFEKVAADKIQIDETAQAIKRVLQAYRKKLFKDNKNKVHETQWMHTIRIAPTGNTQQQNLTGCGCGCS
jgi:hypothetical protein